MSAATREWQTCDCVVTMPLPGSHGHWVRWQPARVKWHLVTVVTRWVALDSSGPQRNSCVCFNHRFNHRSQSLCKSTFFVGYGCQIMADVNLAKVQNWTQLPACRQSAYWHTGYCIALNKQSVSDSISVTVSWWSRSWHVIVNAELELTRSTGTARCIVGGVSSLSTIHW